MMLAIGFIIFIAIFLQTLTGFGMMLVAVPLLALVIDIRIATPMMALIGSGSGLFWLYAYREYLSIRTVARLNLAALIGVPLGVLALQQIEGDLILKGLGIILTGYALYALLGLDLPRLEHPQWEYGFGFVAGILGGAYNTAGPPVVMYGHCREWEPRAFKGNLQTFFFINGLMVIATHAVNGSFNAEVWKRIWVAPPAIALGLVCGFYVEQFFNPVLFRKAVLVLLIILGIHLLL